MNELVFNNITMPVLSGCDLCAASEPFYHADRIIDFNVLIYTVDGAIYVTEDDIDYEVSEGELLFLKSGHHHYGKFEIPKGTRWYFIHFFFEEDTDIPLFVPDNSEIRQYEPVRFSAKLPKKLTGLQGSRIERSITEFIEYFHSSDEMKRWNINVRLSELLGSVCFYSKERSFSLSDRICAFLSERVSEQFSAEKLEKNFFLSYKYMASAFKREKGMTMQQFHNKLRMTTAQTYLKSTLMSIGEISLNLGFNDMLYFSKCFKSFTGMSPTEYRKNAIKTY